MRLRVLLSSKNGEVKVPLDYRRRFISFLKVIFGAERFKENATRPYTFAVYFGKNKPIILYASKQKRACICGYEAYRDGLDEAKSAFIFKKRRGEGAP